MHSPLLLLLSMLITLKYLNTLFFPKFHRKIEGGCSVVESRKGDVVEVKWLDPEKVIRKEK